MENKYIYLISSIISGIISILVFSYLQTNDVQPTHIVQHVCKEDSLQKVINQLQIDIENEEDGWDKKESRYESILFEYEHGLEHLKNYHADAYKEFHRIIGYKENYSHETERENKKRLQSAKW
jgi:hypothetical protein